MNEIKTALLALVAGAVLALPAASSATEVVPPGNSAATQYTEAIPTAGGPKQTGGSKHHRSRSPAEALGKHKARELDSKGPAGKAVAKLAAETAPAARPAPATPEPTSPPPRAAPASSAGGDKTTARRQATAQSAAGRAASDHGNASPARASAEAPPPSGSSGAAAVLAQATGSSAWGGTGLLLPLALLATLAWAAAYLLLRRRQPAA